MPVQVITVELIVHPNPHVTLGHPNPLGHQNCKNPNPKSQSKPIVGHLERVAPPLRNPTLTLASLAFLHTTSLWALGPLFRSFIYSPPLRETFLSSSLHHRSTVSTLILVHFFISFFSHTPSQDRSINK